jgi:hypothetical protein
MKQRRIKQKSAHSTKNQQGTPNHRTAVTKYADRADA